MAILFVVCTLYSISTIDTRYHEKRACHLKWQYNYRSTTWAHVASAILRRRWWQVWPARLVHQFDPPPMEQAQQWGRNLKWLWCEPSFRLFTKLDYFRFAKRIYAGSSCIKQYVFSPLVPSSDSERIGRCIAASSHAPSPMPSQTSPPPRDANQNLQMGRVMSFQTLGDACTSEAAQICRKCLVWWSPRCLWQWDPRNETSHACWFGNADHDFGFAVTNISRWQKKEATIVNIIRFDKFCGKAPPIRGQKTHN